MKRIIVGLALALGLVASSAAQTVANGPYYAVPSWDQTLPAAQRFIVLANMNQEAVLDRETGLVWERTPVNAGVNHNIANSICSGKSAGGRRGWRLAVADIPGISKPSGSNCRTGQSGITGRSPL